jgi:hypothetical protein
MNASTFFPNGFAISVALIIIPLFFSNAKVIGFSSNTQIFVSMFDNVWINKR